jgi:hypothetical protein
MRVSSSKMLVSLAALGAVAAGIAFVCARGLNFTDPVHVSPAALQESSWPAPKLLASPLASPPAATAEPSPAAQPPRAAMGMPDRGGGETATQLPNGFLGPARPDGSQPIQIPQLTPDQAAAAARTASDLINGMLANGGNGRFGRGPAPAQIDPDEAAAVAQSAAKMLNGMFGGRDAMANDSTGDATRTGRDRHPEYERRK